jgi:hypothetical protein
MNGNGAYLSTLSGGGLSDRVPEDWVASTTALAGQSHRIGQSRVGEIVDQRVTDAGAVVCGLASHMTLCR